jgi:3-oxoacyl-[acyl-carrier protein] reductase
MSLPEITGNLNGRRILVTGASADSDIGLSISARLAERGAQLVLVGRRKRNLPSRNAICACRST